MADDGVVIYCWKPSSGTHRTRCGSVVLTGKPIPYQRGRARI